MHTSRRSFGALKIANTSLANHIWTHVHIGDDSTSFSLDDAVPTHTVFTALQTTSLGE